MSTVFAIGMPGLPEMLIILVLVLLLFGGAKLPGLMRNLGRSTVEFKKGMREEDEDEEEESSEPKQKRKESTPV